ncbi:aspartate/glutamate racemase family protein [Georgenia subflava]|uniref:Arylsulfatase n=1 Tax=Georgenia subflava TaxID=1622177 RepID=A0A6N7EJA7_9MICO|nr:aspartate/glutamate racemase family protein [Georgenia subflava]MPV36635.1 hypothetical protein [Georgenia subflava]
MTRLGLLHTVPALAEVFQDLGTELDPDLELVHVVDPALLARAADGITPELAARTAAHARHLAEQGADAVLVTCSSIGECADAAADRTDVPVLRVDRPMAEESVRIATAPGARGRISVLATVETTLGPTSRLIAAAAGAADVAVDAAVVPGAADARRRGEQATHDELVRSAVVAAAGTSDVVVLAQASMADAWRADPRGAGDTPVLSSPLSGLRAALEAGAGRDGRAIEDAGPVRRANRPD